MKRLGLLVALLAVVVGANLALNFSKQSTEPAKREKLMDALAEQAESLTAISIEASDGILLHATLKEGSWHAAHLHDEQDFPVDASFLKSLVSDLAVTSVVEEKSSNPDNFGKLGLRALTNPESQAKKVTLQSAEQTWHLLIGNTSSQRNGSFVRLPDENQTYLIGEALSLPDTKFTWLQNPVLPFGTESIQSISITGDVNWQLINNADDSSWALVDMDEQSSLAYDSILSDTADKFNSIEFDEVQYRDEEQQILANATLLATAAVTLADDEWTLNFYNQSDSDTNWLTVDSQQASWQSQWIYEISEFQRNQILVERSSFIQVPDSGETASP